MTPETKHTYRRLARHFQKVWMYGMSYTPEAVALALCETAHRYRPNYFRRLKNALAFDFNERFGAAAAAEVKAIRNPVTAPGSRIPGLQKTPRLKSLGEDDFHALLAHLEKQGHFDEFAALCLVHFTGARPCELRNIFTTNGLVYIPGAKQSHGGLRGADRLLVIDDQEVFSLVDRFVADLRSSPRSIGAISNRLRQAAAALWPRRRLLPTLYTLRHQMGADLKASGMDPRACAYIMGHQSVRSLSVYGDRRQGDPRRIAVQPADAEAVSKVRERLTEYAHQKFERLTFNVTPSPRRN